MAIGWFSTVFFFFFFLLNHWPIVYIVLHASLVVIFFCFFFIYFFALLLFHSYEFHFTNHYAYQGKYVDIFIHSYQVRTNHARIKTAVLSVFIL